MRRLSLLLTLAPFALLACESDGGIAGPEEPFRFGVPGTSSVSSAVVGTWTRTFVFVDPSGTTRSSETIWAFNADGTAVRTIVTVDPQSGIVDRRDAFARWAIQGQQIVIDFTAPFTGRIQLSFVREGDFLILGGQTYVRAM